MKRLAVYFIVFLLSMSFAALTVSAAGAGSLDTTFGSGGKVITNLPEGTYDNFMENSTLQFSDRRIQNGASKDQRWEH